MKTSNAIKPGYLRVYTVKFKRPGPPTCGDPGVENVFRNMQTTHMTCSERVEILTLPENKQTQTLDRFHVRGRNSRKATEHNFANTSSSCSSRIRRVSCSLILKMKLVPPSLPRSSYVPFSFWFIL